MKEFIQRSVRQTGVLKRLLFLKRRAWELDIWVWEHIQIYSNNIIGTHKSVDSRFYCLWFHKYYFQWANGSLWWLHSLWEGQAIVNLQWNRKFTAWRVNSSFHVVSWPHCAWPCVTLTLRRSGTKRSRIRPRYIVAECSRTFQNVLLSSF